MRYRSNNILAYIPPVENGEGVLKQSLFFREALGMRIFIYNIIDKPSLFSKIFKSKQAGNAKNEALKALHEFVGNYVNEETLDHLSYRIKMGSPLPVLLSQAKKGGYEFIIFDKSGDPGSLTRYQSDKIISRSECPVLTINKNVYVDEVKKIVIPVDISKATKKKLLWATYFAKKFQAKIKIVAAINLNIASSKSLVWRNAEHLKRMLSERGIECSVDILKTEGREKHEVILDYIREEDPGMIIIRTHQESNMSGTQIGQFVSELIHRCKIPVFTVNRFLYPMPVDFEL